MCFSVKWGFCFAVGSSFAAMISSGFCPLPSFLSNCIG
uniref:Uncharacterized protein n=1 Tax=Rhizophora mucronata TaxID=61149 RepID=A0A2P2NQV0_RHIMU